MLLVIKDLRIQDIWKQWPKTILQLKLFHKNIQIVSVKLFQILKPSEKKAKYQYGGMNPAQTGSRPSTPQRNPAKKKWPPPAEPA